MLFCATGRPESVHFCILLPVLVNVCCCNKMPSGWIPYKQQKFISHSSRKSNIKTLAKLVLGKGCFLLVKWCNDIASFKRRWPLCSPKVEETESEKGPSSSFYKWSPPGFITHSGSTSWYQHTFCSDTNNQPIAFPFTSFWMKNLQWSGECNKRPRLYGDDMGTLVGRRKGKVC